MTNIDPKEILKRPYARIVLPEADGSFRAEILEFPGCIALADSAPGALAALEDIAHSWVQGALERGLPIPPPTEQENFSGKLALRLPKSLHRRASYAAKLEGVSLNQFIVTAIAMEVGTEQAKSVPQFQTTSFSYNVANVSAGGHVVVVSGNEPLGSTLTSITDLTGGWQKINSILALTRPHREKEHA